MKVSVIIAVYKDIEALELILEALKRQTYKNFEVVVAEDNNAEEMKTFLKRYEGELEIKHTFQEDKGIRKMRSLNNAILASSGEYLIFIDGDCVPYTTFVAGHVALAEKNYIVSGRRCNLGPKYSRMLREKKLTPWELEKQFIRRFFSISKDAKEGHTEAGLYFDPNGWVYRTFLKNRKSNTSLLGCNYSCFKEAIVSINGYDEGYGQTPIGDDTDLEWRFKAAGYKLKSAKNVANLFHLYHDRGFRESVPYNDEMKKFEENKRLNRYVCKEGLNTH